MVSLLEAHASGVIQPSLVSLSATKKSLPVADLSARSSVSRHCHMSPECFLGQRMSLTLSANEVADLLVFGLFDGAFVVLWSLAEEFLLYVVDACKSKRCERDDCSPVVMFAHLCQDNLRPSRFLFRRRQQS